MRDFFRGWKRKLGVLTLVMACVMAAIWARGLSIADSFNFHGYGPHHYFTSNSHGLMWFYHYDDLKHGYGDAFTYDRDLMIQPAKYYLESEPQQSISILWHWVGFHFSKSIRQGDNFRITILAVPHWSIVTPLILLSAWLLLSRPRKPATGPTKRAA